MRKILWMLILSMFAFSAFSQTTTQSANSSAKKTESRTYYDSNGSRQGTTRVSNGTESHYDKNGQRTGTIKVDANGNQTHYDSNGRKTGTTKVSK